MEDKASLLMRKLNISYEEALQVIADDDAIDHGEKLFELTAEQKKISKKMKNEETKTYEKGNHPKREKKIDESKDTVYTFLLDTIKNLDSNCAGSSNCREISFTNEGKKFKVTLSCPRS